MGQQKQINQIGRNALAVLGWLAAFFPFFAFFGFLKISLTGWLSSAVLAPGGEGVLNHFMLITGPEFVQGFGASFLAIFLAMNFFKKADTFLVSGVSAAVYLVLAVFVFPLPYAPPPSLAIFEVAGVISNPLGVLSALGVFAFREYRIKALAKSLASPKA